MLEGIYESLVTRELAKRLAQTTELEALVAEVDPTDQPHVLARHVGEALTHVLASTKDEARRVEIVNTVLTQLAHPDPPLLAEARQLLALSPTGGPRFEPSSTGAPQHSPR